MAMPPCSGARRAGILPWFLPPTRREAAQRLAMTCFRFATSQETPHGVTTNEVAVSNKANSPAGQPERPRRWDQACETKPNPDSLAAGGRWYKQSQFGRSSSEEGGTCCANKANSEALPAGRGAPVVQTKPIWGEPGAPNKANLQERPPVGTVRTNKANFRPSRYPTIPVFYHSPLLPSAWIRFLTFLLLVVQFSGNATGRTFPGTGPFWVWTWRKGLSYE